MKLELEPIIKNRGERIVIAGPCSAESRDQLMQTSIALAKTGKIDIIRGGVWKPRTRPGGFEGVGAEALEWLAEVREVTGLPVATEVGNCHHAEAAMKAGIDVVWIGARTTSSPFAVQEIADAMSGSDIPVLVKNPVSPDFDLWVGAIERLYQKGLTRLGAILRGFKTSEPSDFRNAPRWETAELLRSEFPGLPILFDPSHSGGKRRFIAPLSHKAMSLGFDGLIVESHINPDAALTDSFQQITPEELLSILG